MDTASTRLAARAVALGATCALFLLAGCASAPGSPAPSSSDTGYSLESQAPKPPTGDVIATGTVIDADGAAQLCLGAVMESYPPQCVGVPLEGWTWNDVEPDDESGTTRWGVYGFTGAYDGTSITPTTTPIPLALFDTIERPVSTPGTPGATSETALADVQEKISDLLDSQVLLASGVENGYLVVDVVWDDGTLQKAADADFGEDVVVMRSALWNPETR
ncbi:hypothetical protein [Microbacterium sp.]|uniref:hypothetical protein n=1 Tax=Microbacterium sp. TaxID=51671 RepID=UPI002736C034|nr:hypothetical protein [Microbacterium sp.]MDP3951919.1 hypothetical protein [Microbacterium sp.]